MRKLILVGVLVVVAAACGETLQGEPGEQGLQGAPGPSGIVVKPLRGVPNPDREEAEYEASK
jgi:hypothetical protein